MKPTRKYKCKDVDMLTASETITDTALSNVNVFQGKRSDLTPQFFMQFKTSIGDTLRMHLGVDSTKKLRDATALLNSIQKPALALLTEFKTNIEADFQADKIFLNETLNTLGFKRFYKDAKENKDQSALINLLSSFKQNMTDELKTGVTAKGMSEDSITAIVGYADTFYNANLNQETIKLARGEVTAAAINAFNSIYDETIRFSKITRLLLKDDPVKRDQFSFTKVLKNITSNRGGSNGGNPPEPPQQ